MADDIAFLFADVEGSTRLVQRLGDAWVGALAQLRNVLRDEVAAAGGREVDARGDEVFAVFDEPQAAAEAALRAQRHLLGLAWAGDAVVRVRMGIHHGTRRGRRDGRLRRARGAPRLADLLGGPRRPGARVGARGRAAARATARPRPLRPRRAARRPSGSSSCSPPTCRRSSRRSARRAGGHPAAADRPRRRLGAPARGNRAAARGRGHGGRRAVRRRRGLLAQVEQHRPDTAIVDIRMPPTYTDDGLRAAAEIRDASPRSACSCSRPHLELEYAVELLRGGAAGIGYLLKDRVADVDDFAAAVRRVAASGAALDRNVVAELVDRPRRPVELDTLTAPSATCSSSSPRAARTRRSRSGSSSRSLPSRRDLAVPVREARRCRRTSPPTRAC